MAIATPVNGAVPPDVPLADIDLSSDDFWSLDHSVRDGAFATCGARLRSRSEPEPEIPGFEVGPGHWVLTTWDDVHHASRQPESSAPGPPVPRSTMCRLSWRSFFGR